MHVFRQPTVIAILLVALGSLGIAWADGSASPPDSFTFRLDTPAPSFRLQEDGTSVVELEGFRTRERTPGVPDLPRRTILVAIPEGATPRLTVGGVGQRSHRAVRPRPVPRLAVADSAVLAGIGADSQAEAQRLGPSIRELFEPDARIYAGRRVYPSNAAWLGRTGVLRNQRYVEVHVAPLRFDPRAGGLIVDSAVEVTVHFDGVAPQSSPPPAEHASFESVYRKAFANYAQGRDFRIGGGAGAAMPASAPQATSGSGTPARRILVRESGPVRLDHALFSSEAPGFFDSDPETWKLTNRGEQVPLEIHQNMGGDDGLLEAGEWVQFYGQALDDEPRTLLDYDSPAPFGDLYLANDFSDVNVYFLTEEALTQPTMAEQSAAPTVATPETSFLETVRLEVDDIFFPVVEEMWFWTPFISEGSPTRTESVPLTGLASGTDPISVRLQVRGSSSCPEVTPDHRTRVSLVNSLTDALVLPAGNPDNVGDENVGEYDGNTLFVHDFDWTHSGGDPVVTDPLDITIEADNLDVSCPSIFGGNVLNDVIHDFIELDYQRTFAVGGDRLAFSWPDSNADFEITGLSTDTPAIFEVTDLLPGSPVVDAVRLTGAVPTMTGATYSVRFSISDKGQGGLRRFIVASDSGVTVPAAADFAADRNSTIQTDTSQADLVVIAHPDLLTSKCSEGGNVCNYDVECTVSPTDVCEIDPTSALADLLARRATQGLGSRVVRIQDLEDEFNDGLAGPLAIRNFLAWVVGGGWGAPAPSYAMLLGDGSYDYKAGTLNGNYVPTQVVVKHSDILAHYSSDNLLAAVTGDDFLPEMIVGRIPVRTPREADATLQKILDYEEVAPAGSWRSSTLTISDRGKQYDPVEALEFERINADSAAALGSSAYTGAALRYWSDYCTPPNFCNTVAMNQAIKDHINGAIGDGVALAQFLGHGNFDIWSDDVIFCTNDAQFYCPADEAATLSNGLKLPWLLVHNCLSAGFHTPALKSFGEQWIKSSVGGAMAVFGPSGLGFRFLGEPVAESIWTDLYGPHKERLIGVPVMNSLVLLCGQGSFEGCQFYTLLGDPTTRLALPDIGAPGSLSATASSGPIPSVSLSWTASSTGGATYDVYRRDFPFSTYNKVAGPIAGTSHIDNSVSLTQRSLYYLVASDGGFDSAQSNFNSDCVDPPGVSGPDCVEATPLNLVPPATPAGLSVTDAESGGRLNVSWLPNPESDIASYTVHYGLDAGLGLTLGVGDGSTASISGLVNGTQYHVAVEATNTSGTISALSPIELGTPQLVLGMHAPLFVDDLQLDKSGMDAVLTWGAVTTSIYGADISVDHYDVYRGTTVNFTPSPGNRIGQPVSPTFTDPGALAAGPDYHYLVQALSGPGNGGGLGGPLPAGVVDLALDRSESTPGNIVLIWSPVTLDVAGGSAQVSEYEVYAGDSPFTRADIETLALAPVASTAGPPFEIEPALQNRYYSVLAVDDRGNKSPF